MTNFEISAERESPSKDLQAGISFHFLSPTRFSSFAHCTGSVGNLDCFAWVSSMRDCSNSTAQGSHSFAMDLPNAIPYMWDWVLVLDEVTLPRSGSLNITTQDFLSFIVADGMVQLLFVAEQQQKVWNSGPHEGACTLLHAGVRSPKTIKTIHICHCFVAPSHRNSMDESHSLTNSRKLDLFFQCLEVLKAFSQSVSNCGVIVPWSLHQRIYFLRSHFFHCSIIFCLRKLF